MKKRMSAFWPLVFYFKVAPVETLDLSSCKEPRFEVDLDILENSKEKGRVG